MPIRLKTPNDPGNRATLALGQNSNDVTAGLTPSGVRGSATGSWGTYDFIVSNPTDRDRLARVLLFYVGEPDVQYGRDLWVPAHSTRRDWMLVGPAPLKGAYVNAREIEALLYDRTDGEDVLVRPPTQEVRRSRQVIYQKREPTTMIVLDELPPEFNLGLGRLPPPEPKGLEAIHLARAFREAQALPTGFVRLFEYGALPPTPETFAGIDHFILASERLSHDVSGMRALRHWLEQGGLLWVMLDAVDPEVLAPLLGDALDFQVVDRIALTRFKTEKQPSVLYAQVAPVEQQHELPIDFVRVLLPATERPVYTVDGWPVWFTRSVGRGRVLFTTLGPRGWYRPRILYKSAGNDLDPASPFPDFPQSPVPRPMLEDTVGILRLPPREKAFVEKSFEPALREEIGYSIVHLSTVATIFAAFLVVELFLGIALRRSRRPELLGWLAPAAALGTVAVLIALGSSGHHTAEPTLALGEVIDATPGMEEASVQGLLGVYQPEPGPAVASVEQGGLFELDATALEGKIRRLIGTDRDAWHWDNLSMPKGVRFAPFHFTATTDQPITAVARYGPDGLEGRLAAGAFQNFSDALIHGPGNRNMSVHLQADGTFRAGSADLMVPGQFLAGAVVSDRQRQRQSLYQEYLDQPGPGRLGERPFLLAWADPLDPHFTLAPTGHRIGEALVAIPLRLERPMPGLPITIPGPLLSYRQVFGERGSGLPPSRTQMSVDNMQIRFQLPAEALPFKVERARLSVRINAPSRRLTVAGQGERAPVPLRQVDSPEDAFQVDLTENQFLRLDAEGGLSVFLSVSSSQNGLETNKRGGPADTVWTIDYLELEVRGQCADEKVTR